MHRTVYRRSAKQPRVVKHKLLANDSMFSLRDGDQNSLPIIAKVEEQETARVESHS